MTRVRHCFLISVFAVIFHIFNSSACAQDTSKVAESQYVWLNAGLGLGSACNFITVGASLSFQYREFLISIRRTAHTGFLDPCKTQENALLCGISEKKKYGFVSITGGISYVTGRRSYSDKFESIGFPIEVQAFFTPVCCLGLGLYGFANLNPQKSFVGCLLCVQIGALHPMEKEKGRILWMNYTDVRMIPGDV